MAEQRESSLSLQRQVRTLAARSSFDGSWSDHHRQKVVVQREASLPGVDFVSLDVKFTGEKFTPNSHRPSQLLTRYVLGATLVYDLLPAEVVPAYVREEVKERELKTYDGEKHHILHLNSEAEDETVTEVIDEYDDSDMLFRFERKLRYLLNGNADLMVAQWSDTHFTIDGDEEVAAERVGSLYFRNKDSAAEQWGRAAGNTPAAFLDHPDLLALEYRDQKRELKTDLSFWEVIETTERDEALRLANKKDHAQQVLALVAFLNHEVPAQSILNLVQ